MDYEEVILENRKGKPSYTTRDLAQVEYDISKKLREGGITCVPKVYKIATCDERNTNDKNPNTILYSEFINGRDLTKPLKLKEYVSVLVQTIYNLYKIHEKFPTFRHHDLHLGNIMIKRRLNFMRQPVPKNIKITIPSSYRVPENSLFSKETENVNFILNDAGMEVFIIDFGLSHLPEAGITNPPIEFGVYKESHGMFKDSDQSYDLHLFLVSLYIAARRESREVNELRKTTGKKILEFIEKALVRTTKKGVPEFLSNRVISQARLRHNASERTIEKIPNYTILLNMIHSHFKHLFKINPGQQILQAKKNQALKTADRLPPIPSSTVRNLPTTKTPVIATNKKNSPKPLNQAQKQQHAAMVLQAQRKGQMGTARQIRPASRIARQPTNRPPTAAKTSQSIARSPTAAKTSRTTVTLRNPVLERVKTSNIPASSRATPSRNQKNKNTGGAVKSTNPSSSVNNRTPSTMVHSTKKNRKTNRRSNNSSN